MSNEKSEKYCYKFLQHHFLLLLYEPDIQSFADKYRYHRKKGNKRKCDRVSCISVSWIVCCILLKLFCINIKFAETRNTALLQNNTGDATLVVAPAINTTTAKIFLADKTVVNSQSQHLTFSELEKEVVERLIKEWAPVVWLAPEEKFMPLGVEEFLAHVHPESKDNSFTPGMSFEANSEKSFLVTNTEIDQLLENDTSFIYGRNPNMTPVPIYAVVTLCTQYKKERVQKHSKVNLPNLKPVDTNYSPQLQKSVTQPNFLHPGLETAIPTRGPYIPITFGPQAEVDSNLRRSSRLYPIFQRIKRNLPSLPNIPSAPQYNLVTENSVHTAPVDRLLNSEPIKSNDERESKNDKVNNFIANLVDNVKFSVSFTEQNDKVFEKVNDHLTSAFIYTERATVPSFHVTYWMFYPYSQGKNMCTLNLGPFGRIPFPAVYGYCLGRKKDIGSHIGDWEHMTLYFTGLAEPEAMYVSAHDAGAYYAYNRLTGSFEFKRQETRKGILQRPNFPKTVTTFNDHPVLFAAKGSHGLWTAPGKHRFVKVARLYDINGFGTPWNTWKHVQITFENLKSYGRAFIPSWLSFKGKWGNPKSKCHPLRRIGLNFCEFTDGPTGIPLKEPHFQCGTSFRR